MQPSRNIMFGTTKILLAFMMILMQIDWMEKSEKVLIDIGKGTLIKCSREPVSTAITGLKILNKALTVLRYTLVIGVSTLGTIGAIAIVAFGCTPFLGCCWLVHEALYIVLMYTPFPYSCVFAMFGINPLMKFLQQKVEWEISKRGILANPPFDLRRASIQPAGMQERLIGLLPSDYGIGGTKELVVKFETDTNAKAGRTIYLCEITKSDTIIGYIARGKKDGIYHYITHANAQTDLWNANVWIQITCPADFAAAAAKS